MLMLLCMFALGLLTFGALVLLVYGCERITGV